MSGPTRIIVGISGGVDSAVAALCLLRAGHQVEGLHMSNWDEADAYCTAAADYQQARKVCTQLGIPLHRADFSREYRTGVFAEFLREYGRGRTPNPDVLCNRVIKFGSFLAHARRLGADLIATGHYARVATDGSARLLKGRDPAKDQSYFLHAVDPAVLPVVRFPVGHLTKTEVRRLAVDAGLVNHDRPDSTGICFIGERPFREFLQGYLPRSPGQMESAAGEIVGQHEGLTFYTIGQRSGLGIGGQGGGDGAPWYVAAKDTQRNALIVVQGRQHPLLWSHSLIASGLRWIGGKPLASNIHAELNCHARIRHRQPDAACRLINHGSGCRVEFAEPQWAVTPGQYVVFYQGDECLGGGTIETAESLTESVPRLPQARTA